MIGNPQQNYILTLLKTKGCSVKTGNEGLAGIDASRLFAKQDLAKVLLNLKEIKAAGNFTDITPALIAGIGSRESRFGKLLKNDWGDNGYAYGICQVDKRSHEIVLKNDQGWLPHFIQVGKILKDFQRQIGIKHPSWSAAEILRGAVAAYNVGVHNVQTIDGMDIGTTHDDYSSDVWERARYYAGIV
jgi:hypothetical protein